MLALNKKINFSLVVAGTILFLANSVMGMQTPSQRYSPVQSPAAQTSPPSVHVPALPSQQLDSATQGKLATISSEFTFSDRSNSVPAQANATSRPAGEIRAASFQTPDKKAPPIPPALNSPASVGGQTPASKQPLFAAQADTRIPPQARRDFPKRPAGSLAEHSTNHKPLEDYKSGMQNIRPSSSSHPNFDISSDPTITDNLARMAAAAESRLQKSKPNQPGQFQSRSAMASIATPSKTGIRATNKSTARSTNDHPASPTLVAKQVNPNAAGLQLTQSPKSKSTIHPPMRDPMVRTASTENDEPMAAINLRAPAIQVESFGPRTIGINKSATFKVVVRNNSAIVAQKILVGIDIPAWVDIENVNLTAGAKEINDGTTQSRLTWNIDRIAGNTSQTMIITAVPRKPETFDLGVEWTLVPRVGKATISVTQPRLEMNISGPHDVLYGELAKYHVTVRNPGTGTAEKVVVALPEVLGGARTDFGDIKAGEEKHCQVELMARTSGEMNLIVTATAEDNLRTSAEKELLVRQAKLEIALNGPGLKYSGSKATYKVTLTNSGDATATKLETGFSLPAGVKYISGIESFNLTDGYINWSVGSLDPGQTRSFQLECQLDTSGDLQLEVAARGHGGLAASGICVTTVETVADLVLSVEDPKGPLPTGKDVEFEIKIKNRGTKSAKGVNLVMQFSKGVEPQSANGLEYRIVPGQVLFSPITQIEPGQQVTFKVTAQAIMQGTHVFRAQLTCDEDADAHEMAEGTTRFYGESIQPKTTTLPSTANAFESSSDFGGFNQPSTASSPDQTTRDF